MSSAVIQVLLSAISDDAFAASFQTLGQYRKALASICMTALDAERISNINLRAAHDLNELTTTGCCRLPS